MLEQLRTQESDGSETRLSTGERKAESESEVLFSGSLFRLGRAIFGGVLAYLALDNFRNLEGRVQYAEMKGAPKPEWTVPANTAGLLLGGLGLTLWRLPRASAAAIAGFFISVTPLMHDYWNVEDDEQRQQEQIQFMKNAALLGAALSYMRLGTQSEQDKQ